MAVGELIFGRVEACYSPTNRSGFQTIFHTPSLNTADVKLIEDRVRTLDTEHRDAMRVQFFPLSGERFAITRTITIEPDVEIVDRYRRGGAFLAHCFVIDRDLLAQLQGQVFHAIGTLPWVTKAGEAVRRNGFDTSWTTILKFDSKQTRRFEWDSVENSIKRLLPGADSAPKTGESILLIGSPSEAEEFLRCAFKKALYPGQIANMSFDTSIDRREIAPGTYWAVGARRDRPGPYYRVDLASRKFIPNEDPGPKRRGWF